MQLTVLCVLFSAVTQNAVAMRGLTAGRGQPNPVAKVLVEVEKHWLNWALASVDCDTANATGCSVNGTSATAEFMKSCSTVSTAIMKTTAGDKSRMQSYMSGVCGEEELKGQLEELCLDYSQVLAQEMTDFQHENLEGAMNLSKVCVDFFHEGYLGRYAAKEGQRLREVHAAEAVEAQKKAEIAEAAEANNKAEAKAALARKRLEEMSNATADATQKREEAVRASVEAQRKAEEVEEAEQVQKRLQKEAEDASAEARAVKVRLQERLAARKAKQDAANTTQSGNKTSSSVNRTAKSFLATSPFTFS